MVEIIVALVVAFQTVIQVVIQRHYSKKDDIDSIKKAINEIDDKYKNISMTYAKTFLIDMMSRIRKGESMNDEQIRLLYEMKQTYNKARWGFIC